jgi:hypothetical protein
MPVIYEELEDHDIMNKDAHETPTRSPPHASKTTPSSSVKSKRVIVTSSEEKSSSSDLVSANNNNSTVSILELLSDLSITVPRHVLVEAVNKLKYAIKEADDIYWHRNCGQVSLRSLCTLLAFIS